MSRVIKDNVKIFSQLMSKTVYSYTVIVLLFIDTQEKKTNITQGLRNEEHRITLGFFSLDAPCAHACS